MKNLTRILGIFLIAGLSVSHAQMTQKQQSKLTPDQVLAGLLEGNARFASGASTERNYTSKLAASAKGQFPQAVILSCLDSRVPVELVFDQAIGDVFVGRVAGNIEDRNQLGSMEFATKLSGARLVLVLGHDRCGAVRGAIAGAELGNLTQLLDQIKPAVDAVKGFPKEERTAGNPKFLKAATEENVRQTVANIRKHSPILAKLEKSGDIKIVGAMYELETGKVAVLE